jgi:hypothetical protein
MKPTERSSIRLPADVELSTKLINLNEGTTDLTNERCYLTVETQPAGKFNKVIKVIVSIPSLGECVVVVPRGR